jgi:uncharacterized protein (DUF2147 family)
MGRLSLIALCAALAATAPSAAATGVFGLWATGKNNGRVLIEPCGAALCGHVVDGSQLHANPNQKDVNNPDAAKRQRPVRGLMILEGYSGGPPQWRGGSVYDPQTGDEAHDSTLTLVSPGTLKVEGCRLLLCRSETWTRLN